ncbi:MAG: EutN/CcmL family microcompartment protein [bacterium]|nr:EutN/CcmL family microcompartment protein [candidate division KSB1 bacterium]MDH7560556.1 EutN/CcmL family microcompartment protein [bacterium]
MEIARVVGTVVSTCKDEKLNGSKLLIVNLLTPEVKPTSTYLVAVDTVGAGEGEVVLIVRGSSARMAKNMTTTPTDTSIIGIVDTLELEGKVVFQKFGE